MTLTCFSYFSDQIIKPTFGFFIGSPLDKASDKLMAIKVSQRLYAHSQRRGLDLRYVLIDEYLEVCLVPTGGGRSVGAQRSAGPHLERCTAAPKNNRSSAMTRIIPTHCYELVLYYCLLKLLPLCCTAATRCFSFVALV